METKSKRLCDPRSSVFFRGRGKRPESGLRKASNSRRAGSVRVFLSVGLRRYEHAGHRLAMCRASAWQEVMQSAGDIALL